MISESDFKTIKKKSLTESNELEKLTLDGNLTREELVNHSN